MKPGIAPPAERPLRELFGVALGQISRLWRGEIDRRLSPFELTAARWLTLLHLSRLDRPVTQRELAELVSVQGPTLVRTLDWLERKRLIERRPSTGDRRAKSVHLTPEAKPVLDRIQVVVESLRGEILSGVDDSELRACLRVFRQIADRLGHSAPLHREAR